MYHRFALHVRLLLACLVGVVLPGGLQAQVFLPKMVRVPAGSFLMGHEDWLPDTILPGDRYSRLLYLRQGDADERPVHPVRIGQAFDISASEVTVQEFQAFDPNYRKAPGNRYCTGVSWWEAMAYCEWLSARTGHRYRLPTEAEWEHVARLQGQGGVQEVVQLFEGPAEWCLDWYAPYTEVMERDPSGPVTGLTKVIRGGGLDRNGPFFRRAANRASMPPSFPPERHAVLSDRLRSLASGSLQQPMEEAGGRLGKEQLYQNFIRQSSNNQGNHDIGFRVVRSDARLQPHLARRPFPLEGVKVPAPQHRQAAPSPWFMVREVLPTPMDDCPDSVLAYLPILGLPEGLLSHNHSPALEVMPNGDVLMVIYTSVSETTHDVKLMVSRLRFGAQAWDMPEILLDCADANDHAPLLWQEGDTTWLFWGNNKYEASFPFQWTRSFDYGHTWEPIQFPVFRTPVLEHSAQPITSAFRDAAGIIYVGSDGVGSASVLWRSEDQGKTWIDPGGRTQGRHSAFLPLRDGRILAIGGKNSHVEGAMPKFLSVDKGAHWTVARTPFMPLGSGQRPSAIRLQSGRILVSGDFDSRMGQLPDSLRQLPRNRGCYVAYSDDEGEHWTIKQLPATRLGNTEEGEKRFRTLGYSVLRQGPNGNIHLLATVVHPVLHYEFNEAWLTNPDTLVSQAPASDASIGSVITLRDTYLNGRLRHLYQLAQAPDGRYWLQGEEAWYDSLGAQTYAARHHWGQKIGLERFWVDGKPAWSWEHGAHSSRWTTFQANGRLRSVSHWVGKYAHGEATAYDAKGRPVRRIPFAYGGVGKE